MKNQFISDLSQCSTPMIMGILNVTPDSFSDGGQFQALDQSMQHVESMIAEGASIIDVGGESTRPGAAEVTIDEELERVVPIIEAIKKRFDIYVSVDTSKAQVIDEAVSVGVDLINDVRALTLPDALSSAVQAGLPVCLMHMQGKPQTMQDNPAYQQVVNEVLGYLLERVEICVDAGIARENIILDPGFGFGKTPVHNYQLLEQLNVLTATQYPVLSGLSRKSMIGYATGHDVDKRIYGSVAGALISAQKGAKILRVHDVQATADVLAVYRCCLEN